MSRRWVFVIAMCFSLCMIGWMLVAQDQRGTPSRAPKESTADAGQQKADGPDGAYVKCEMSGVLYHGLKLGSADHIETYILSKGLFWEVDTSELRISRSQLKAMNGRRVVVNGLLRDADVAGSSKRRVLDASLLELAGFQREQKDQRGPQSKPYIRGYVVTTNLAVRGDQHHEKLVTIHVPGVLVFLTDPVTREVKSRTHTDLSGRFDFPPQPPGSYQLCWRADGFIPGCLPDPIVVTTKPVFVGDVVIPVERREHRTTIYGHVSKRDGRGPRWFDPLSNVNAFAQVVAVDSKGKVVSQAQVNNSGDYIFPQVPDFDNLQVRAEMEGGRETRSINKLVLAEAPIHRLNVVMSNRSPKIGPLVPHLNGKRARRADPGDVVVVSANAEDADGDPLTYFWSLPTNAGTLSETEGKDTKWTLPAVKGKHELTLVVRDGKGGYSRSRVRLATREGVLFSGRVVDRIGPPVADAIVEINGQTAKSNAQGYFRIDVKEAARFVFNIRKPGYALLSQIYQEGVTGCEWTLKRAAVVSVDPTKPIKVIDPRMREECHLPFSARTEWERFPEQRRPRLQDGKGNIRQIGSSTFRLPILERLAKLREQKGCGPGITIQIPANSLVDENGNPPVGNVNVSISTVDLLAPFDMPGDFTVRVADGTHVMESWGAGIVEISQGPSRFNLKDGAVAKITIPMSDIQLLDARPEPDKIPLLNYDEVNGVWTQVGEAQRVGNEYVAEVRHFSAFNADLVKVNQSCVRIHSPQATPDFPQGLPETYKLEITIPQGPGVAPKILTKTVDNSVPYHVIYNLPNEVDIILVPFSVSGDVPYGTFIVNTGPPQVPTDPNRPAYPYDACQSEVVLYDVGLPTPPTDAFLHGLYTFAATNLDELDPADPGDNALLAALDQATEDYYALIDPRDLREDLPEFLAHNGFDGTEINAKYVNGSDLGFGRDMHGIKTLADDGQFDYAFAVSNFGSFDLPDLEDFQSMFDPAETPFATVCMEYSRIENPLGDPDEFTDPERVIKFYVYNAAGALVNKAQLDEFGARPIPQLCVVCHGGTVPHPGGPFVTDGDVPAFNLTDDVKMGSVFLPFDLTGLEIFDGIAPGFDKADQQDEIHALNQLVKESNPGVAIIELIDAMYPFPGSTVQEEDFALNDWALDPANAQFYKNVIARSCRMCHVSRPLEVGRDIRFREFAPTVDALVANAINFRVCTTKQMPHAHITFKRFWGSQDPAGTSILYPYQPAQLIAWGQTFVSPDYASSCAAPPPPDLPGVVTYAQIQQLFTNNCVACHTPGGIAAFLPLDDGVSHGNIVNASSVQLPAMDRIEPGAPDDSYLLHKLNGTQAGVGGSGSQMPLGAPPLSVGEISLVEQWILEGALGP